MSRKKHYVLRRGVPFSYVVDGNPHNVIGDGAGTLELNDDQAAAFRDKLIGESPEAVAFTQDAESDASIGEDEEDEDDE